jgi:hypothetical protein
MSSETDRPSLDKIMRRIARYRANPHRRYGLDRLADSWLQRIRRRWLRIIMSNRNCAWWEEGK